MCVCLQRTWCSLFFYGQGRVTEIKKSLCRVCSLVCVCVIMRISFNGANNNELAVISLSFLFN